MPRKPPKLSSKQQELVNQQIDAAYERGRTSGALSERKMINDDLGNRRAEVDLKALNAAGQLVQSMSQAVEALCRAMYNGRGM